MNDTPLKPWVAAKTDGTIITAHGNCMAGLGEVCSHVGAILFAVEAGVRIVKAKTCTSMPCKWLMPTSVNNVPYTELRNIDFTTAKTKKRKLDEKISQLSSEQSQASTLPSPTTAPKPLRKPTSIRGDSIYVPSQAQIKPKSNGRDLIKRNSTVSF
jgi:hypothetical protein